MENFRRTGTRPSKSKQEKARKRFQSPWRREQYVSPVPVEQGSCTEDGIWASEHDRHKSRPADDQEFGCSRPGGQMHHGGCGEPSRRRSAARRIRTRRGTPDSWAVPPWYLASSLDGCQVRGTTRVPRWRGLGSSRTAKDGCAQPSNPRRGFLVLGISRQSPPTWADGRRIPVVFPGRRLAGRAPHPAIPARIGLVVFDGASRKPSL